MEPSRGPWRRGSPARVSSVTSHIHTSIHTCTHTCIYTDTAIQSLRDPYSLSYSCSAREVGSLGDQGARWLAAESDSLLNELEAVRLEAKAAEGEEEHSEKTQRIEELEHRLEKAGRDLEELTVLSAGSKVDVVCMCVYHIWNL